MFWTSFAAVVRFLLCTYVSECELFGDVVV